MPTSRTILASTLAWSTRLLAIAAALVAGRATQASAATAVAVDSASYAADPSGAEVSYVQVDLGDMPGPGPSDPIRIE